MNCSFTTTNVVGRNQGMSYPWSNITGIRFTYSGAAPSFYMDNLIVNTTLSSSVGEICGYDMSPYLHRGSFTPSNYYDINSISVYENFILPMKTTVEGIGLTVNGAQYIDDSNILNYFLTVNGRQLGNPDCFDAIDTGQYVLFWKTSIQLNNQTMSLNFSHTVKTGNRYWIVGGGTAQEDLDGDGDITSGCNQLLYQDCKWIWLGPFPFYVCRDIYSTVNLFDLAYQFYYTQPIPVNQYNYTDSLGLSGYVYKNATGYVYRLNDLSDIACSYLLNDPSYEYTLSVTHNGTVFNEQGFPITCYYPGGVAFLSPNRIGKYEFSLIKATTVCKIIAWVIGTLPQTYIKTSPSMTFQYDPYNVIYRFTHIQGFHGAYALFDSYQDINDYSKKVYGSDINNNESDNFTYYSVSPTTEYWRLFVNRNGSYFPIGNLATHYIGVSGLIDNIISFSPTTLTIVDNNAENLSVYVTGQHAFIGCDVGIYVNGVLYKSVKYEQNFYCFYAPHSIGLYTIDLRMNQNGTIVILAHSPYVLTVTTEITIEPEHGLLEPPFSYIAGAILTILFLVMPVILIGTTVKDIMQSDLLKYIPVFSGSLGFVVSCLIGFFPWYAIFILVSIIVMILAVLYLSKKNQ
jgi:hypothetical protein